MDIRIMEATTLQPIINTSCNGTVSSGIELSNHRMFELIFNFTVISMATSANLIVILCLWKDTSADNCGFNTYAISMAFTDLLVGAVLVPLYTYVMFFPSWPLGIAGCNIMMILTYGLTSMSTFLFMTMGYDRYRCVIAPIKYRCQFKRSHVIRLSLTVCCLGFVIWIPYILYTNSVTDAVTECNCLDIKSSLAYFDIIQITFALYIPVIILVVMNGTLILTLNKRQHISQSGKYKPRQRMWVESNHPLSNTCTPTDVDVSTVEESTTITDNPSTKVANVHPSTSILPLRRPTQAEGSVLEVTSISSHLNRCSETSEFAKIRKPTENLHCLALSSLASGDRKSRKNARKLKTGTYKIVLMITIFLLFWLPVCIAWPLYRICDGCVSENLNRLFLILPFGQSAANPLVVIFTSRTIRSKLSSFCGDGLAR